MNPFSELVQIMEERGSKNNGYELSEALITSIRPLKIMMNKVDIGINLYINPALLIGDIDKIETNEAELKEALKQIYKAFKLEVGDRVIVKRVDNKFYIISKVLNV